MGFRVKRSVFWSLTFRNRALPRVVRQQNLQSRSMLPARLSYLKPLASSDECVPFFFHVPKAGGSTIKALSMEVYRYNSQDPLGTPVAIAAWLKGCASRPVKCVIW